MGRYTLNTTNIKYPNVPLSPEDYYIIAKMGDSLDKIALQYYGDSSLYWVISIANPNIISKDSIYIPPGEQVRIPYNHVEVVSSFNTLNKF